jgi:hypothetical protein
MSRWIQRSLGSAWIHVGNQLRQCHWNNAQSSLEGYNLRKGKGGQIFIVDMRQKGVYATIRNVVN